MEAYGLEPQVVITYELLVGTDGGEDVQVGRQLRRHRRRRRRSSSARSMSHPGQRTRAVVEARRSTASLPGATRWSRSSRSRAGSSRASTGRRRRARQRSISRAWCGRARRPRRFRSASLPAGDPVHLPALLAEAFGALDERGAPADRAGRRQARRRRRERARRAAGTARRGGSPGRQAALRSAQRSRLTHARDPATLPRLPERAAWKSPCKRRKRSVSGGFPARGSPASPRPLARVGAFFMPSRRLGP